MSMTDQLKESPSNLAAIYRSIGLTEYPAWAEEVNLVHQYTGEPLVPRPAQLEGVRLALASDNHRFGLYDEAGGGKSLISYLYIAWYAGMGNKVLVLMPPKLLRQYHENFVRIFQGLNGRISISRLDMPGEEAKCREMDRWEREGQPDVVLMSFDVFRDRHRVISLVADFDVVVGDEVRWMSNPENAISQAVLDLMGEEGEKAALMMNGTPARNNLLNLYGYIQFTSPGSYRNRQHYERRHVVYDKFFMDVTGRDGQIRKREVQKIVGYRNLKELYENLYRRGRRITVDQAEPEIVLYEFSLSDRHMELYRELVDSKLLIFDDNTVLDITEASRVRHTCMTAVIDPSILKLKGESEVIKTVKEMLDEHDFEQNGKVLLTAYYQHSVELLMSALKEYNPAVLYGKVQGAAAEKQKQRFLQDPECKVMIINYESGGVGVDGLQNVCWTGIAVEPTSVPGDFQQTIKRLARPGQTRPVKFTCLVVTGTIYRRVTVDRMKKAQAIHEVVDRDSLVSALELRNELLGI